MTDDPKPPTLVWQDEMPSSDGCPRVNENGEDKLLERLRKYHVEPRSPPPAGLDGGSSD